MTEDIQGKAGCQDISTLFIEEDISVCMDTYNEGFKTDFRRIKKYYRKKYQSEFLKDLYFSKLLLETHACCYKLTLSDVTVSIFL